METVEKSITLGIDSIVHSALNNNRKMIDDSGSDVHLDSGYASTASISYNQTVASASNSMKKSLEPIAENTVLTFDASSETSIIETPTTRAGRLLSDFHFNQTPPYDRRVQETTPTKANYFFNALRPTEKSSSKKNRSWIQSPYKLTPNRRKSNGANYSSSAEKMRSADSDSENIDESFEMSVSEALLSPIGHNNKSLISAVPIMHDNKGRTLQRHPSGIESSTPISRSIKRTHTQTIAKTHFDEDTGANARYLLRKTHSFSPRKRSALKEISNSRPIFERHDEQLEAIEEAAAIEQNPAKKKLAFSEDLLTGQILFPGTASAALKPIQTEPCIKEPITPTKSLRTKRVSALQRQQRIAFSPSPAIASPVRSEVDKQSIQEKATRRPVKRLERSTSFNPTSPLKPLKRSASSVIGDETTVDDVSDEPLAKRKLYYDGREKMDILSRLKPTTNVTNAILKLLSDKDLYVASHICKSWAQIIADNTTANLRQKRYARASENQKENTNAQANRTQPSPPIPDDVKRKPFGRRNIHYLLRPSPRRSPPVSPSKRKFHENQKVSTDVFSVVPIIILILRPNPFTLTHTQAVQKLKPGQSITRCPRCGGDSIVHMASEPVPSSPSPRKLKPSVLFARRKGYSVPLPSTSAAAFGAATKAWKSFDDSKKTNAVTSEYAECVKLACGYSFCTKCHCERHTDSVCSARPISSSPTSDEDSTPRPSDRRSSRRNLRRLLD